ncbi:hypothetical protein JE943_002437 [Flavobacterium psychrophilum]|nr:hypothetical protein [Flavobacterium psychrophilum]
MKIIKYIVISILAIYILLCTIVAVFAPKTIMISGEDINIEKPWRKPLKNENETFKRLLEYNNFTDFHNIYLKDIENENYIIAFLNKDKKWDYCWASPKRNDLTRLSDEIKEELPKPE